MENTKGMFIIEKVNGQSLLSKQIIDYLASFSKDQITLDKNELKKLTKELENPSENQSSIMLRDKISQLKRDIARKENIQSKLPSIQKDIASGAFAEMTDYELKKFLTSKYNIAEAPFIDFMTDVEGALKKLYPDKLE